MRKLWLGRYISIPSFYHSLDPRAKLLMMMINIIMIICISTWPQLLVAICFTFTFLYLSKISFLFYMKQAMYLKYMYIFFIVFFALTEGTDVLFEIGSIHVTVYGLMLGIFYSTKMILFVLMGALLTFTTAPNELVAGAKALIRGKSMEKFAFMVSLSIRLIPMILDEVKLIYSAQQSRGLDFSEIAMKDKLSKLMSLIIPAISNTIKRLTMMMDSMECRGYIVGESRTSIYRLNWMLKDTIILVSGIMILVGIILL